MLGGDICGSGGPGNLPLSTRNGTSRKLGVLSSLSNYEIIDSYFPVRSNNICRRDNNQPSRNGKENVDCKPRYPN